MFNDRLEVHNMTMVKIQHTWYTHYHERPQWGGGGWGWGPRICVHPPPPHRKSNNFLFAIWMAFQLLLSIFFSFFEKTIYCCRTRRLSVRLSVCVNNFFCGNLISSRPIHLKIGLNVP